MPFSILKNRQTYKSYYLSSLSPNEIKAVLEFVRLLREKYGSMIKRIILFGSKVTGGSDKDSDIDILIVLNVLSWEIKKAISEIAAQENTKHNVIISTIRYDVNTWENPAVKSSPFVKAVIQEGIWL